MKEETAERSACLSIHKRFLAHCSNQLEARGNDVDMHNFRRFLVKKYPERALVSTIDFLVHRFEAER